MFHKITPDLGPVISFWSRSSYLPVSFPKSDHTLIAWLSQKFLVGQSGWEHGTLQTAVASNGRKGWTLHVCVCVCKNEQHNTSLIAERIIVPLAPNQQFTISGNLLRSPHPHAQCAQTHNLNDENGVVNLLLSLRCRPPYFSSHPDVHVYCVLFWCCRSC